ncbi:MAG: ecdysteroid 22-kinase family protein [Gammaproteobacteria bacterium]|nr:ecdysteroid 22-kinase family protein [Gammaproteobacteria bacterium]
MPREMPGIMRQKVLHILRERFESTDIDIHSAVYLSEPERRNVLMRITLTSTSNTVPQSLILKQVLPQAADANDKQADARFARDWAGLEFTSHIQENTSAHSTPLFYGSDSAERFILIEDLGQPHVSLVDTLTRPNQDKAVSALERYMKTLGRFHATTFNHSDAYASVLESINPEATTPEEDLVSTAEYLLPKLETSIQSLALPMSALFLNETDQVLSAIFRPGPFTVLTHGDIAPDNVFDHEGTEGLQLIDFEWCAPRNALLDGTYLRMSIPTGWCAKTIPDNVLEPLEQMYRAELEKTIPAASDDLAYSTAYTHACAFHVLHQMAQLPDILEQDIMWGSDPMPEGVLPEGALWDQANNLGRSRFLSRLQTFIDVANEHDRLHSSQPPILPHLREMAKNMLHQAKEHWPKDTKPLDTFPAFKQNTLQLTQKPTSKKTTQYKNKVQAMHQDDPGHMAPTISSEAKRREKHTPLDTTPKKPWKP